MRTEDFTEVRFWMTRCRSPRAADWLRRCAHTHVVVATGATASQIGLDSGAFQGRGVSSCAFCVGAFLARATLVIVGGRLRDGGGNLLTKSPPSDDRAHRRESARLEGHAERARANEKIDWESLCRRRGAWRNAVSGLLLRETDGTATKEISCTGLFVAIGHDPTTTLFQGMLDMDSNGYLVQQPGSTATRVPGVFAAGDVADHVYRQAVTAAGNGCMAALDAERWLAEQA